MKKLLMIIAIFSLNLIDKPVQSDGHVETVWETEKVFELPESVIYDSKNDVLYVSNITDHPFKKDGTGYISKIGLDGTIIKKKWINKLNAPKGLTITNDKLYIADVDELVEVDIATARNQGIGANVTITGIVTNGDELGVIRYIQDNTAGMALYDASLASLQRGDEVTVSGTLVDYNGLLEMNPVNSNSINSPFG